MRLPIIDALDLRDSLRPPCRPPRVYLDARYSRRQQMLAVREDLQRAGYLVTSRWIEGAHQADFDRASPADFRVMARFAAEDLEDLTAADLVISFQEVPRRPSTNRGGRHVEFGVAVALGKPIVAVGPLEHVFTALPAVSCFSAWPAALQVLQRLRPAWGTDRAWSWRLQASAIAARRRERLQVELVREWVLIEGGEVR
jgi:hypothetical protein